MQRRPVKLLSTPVLEDSGVKHASTLEQDQVVGMEADKRRESDAKTADLNSDSKCCLASLTLDKVTEDLRVFAKARDWDQFHTPRNILLALVGEVGELSEIFQWKGEVPRGLPGWSEKEKKHLGEELSDVLLYLIRLADITGVDLNTAVKRKMEKNADKYPAERCRGSSAKYTRYMDLKGESEEKEQATASPQKKRRVFEDSTSSGI
ncbi:hypothetical protein CYMTET_29423 [Cymbomonas tetramitiformis]|uniref:Uncharacterized protein n=1 Tax=Cymbomonas tetramitiformis TaxID=36881 RepID=A0AAE0FL38_9CHLO|nr:hypothetical protein CYMTET_29423 [Cymbomonas tetramitiformis]